MNKHKCMKIRGLNVCLCFFCSSSLCFNACSINRWSTETTMNIQLGQKSLVFVSASHPWFGFQLMLSIMSPLLQAPLKRWNIHVYTLSKNINLCRLVQVIFYLNESLLKLNEIKVQLKFRNHLLDSLRILELWYFINIFNCC